MRGFFLAASLAMTLSGCAHAPMESSDADCRHLLSSNGEPLRLCETGNQLTVDDKPMNPDAAAHARLIDDPEFLAAMVAQLSKPPAGASRRKGPETRVCNSSTPGYITIAASDLVALAHANQANAQPPQPETLNPSASPGGVN